MVKIHEKARKKNINEKALQDKGFLVKIKYVFHVSNFARFSA